LKAELVAFTLLLPVSFGLATRVLKATLGDKRLSLERVVFVEI